MIQGLRKYPELAHVGPALLLREVCAHDPSLQLFRDWSVSRLTQRICTLSELRTIVYGKDRSRPQIVGPIVQEIVFSNLNLPPDELTLDYVFKSAQHLYPDLGWGDHPLLVGKSKFSNLANLPEWRAYLRSRQLAPTLHPPRQHDSEVNNADDFHIDARN